MKNIVKGNLTSNPILRTNKNNTPYALFTVAENRFKRTADGQFEKSGVIYHRCIAYNNAYEQVSGMVKGQQVIATGFTTILPAKGSYTEKEQLVVTGIVPGLKPGERPEVKAA